MASEDNIIFGERRTSLIYVDKDNVDEVNEILTGWGISEEDLISKEQLDVGKTD